MGIAAFAVIALAGCAGNGAGLDANGNPISAGGTGALSADFKSIQDNVFTPICTKCHAGAGAPEGLQLDAAHSYALLVGVPSTEQPAVLRVAPGNPDNSYLARKLAGAAGISGVRMPLGGPYLPQSTLDVIRQWITDGASQSMAATASMAAAPLQRFAVASSSPERDSIVSMVLPRIVIAFSGEIDTSLLNDTTVMLRRVTPSGIDAMADPVDASLDAPTVTAGLPISISVPKGNAAALLIAPRMPLTNGTYRVTLRGTGGGALADINAQTLGADYSFTFTVDVSR